MTQMESAHGSQISTSSNLTKALERRRESIARGTTARKKSELGQFMTAAPIANFMSRLFSGLSGAEIRLLDAGAGMGSLVAAFEREAVNRGAVSISAEAWEIDPEMVPHLEETLMELAASSAFSYSIKDGDFVWAASRDIALRKPPRFTHAILNPPYKKLGGKSDERMALRDAGIETGNFYSAFVALALLLLEEGGELVAITPRSFCNGTYFRSFRQLMLVRAALTHVHVFESRTKAFKGDEVLQENVIFRLVKGAQQGNVTVSTSTDGSFADIRERSVPFTEVVLPDDTEAIIHLVPDEDCVARNEMARFTNSLEDIGIGVATGPVVDFRLREYLSDEPRPTSVPLIYPMHFENGFVIHPKTGKKPNWIDRNDTTEKWLMPSGHYVLVRRLSSKEEKRRLVPAVFDPAKIAGEKIGFENHVNVFHGNKAGLPADIARGLAVWLGSTTADEWLRRFNGHTQVNAGDLRALRYPDLETLKAWGRKIGDTLPSQEEIDAMVAQRGKAGSAWER